ncbi:hypothetical protein KHC28_13855 [Ancylobacter sonchi]|nr:hypothetical protein [Ancylobacter sonchi]
MLALTPTLTDHASIEKVGESAAQAEPRGDPEAIDPTVDDIACHPPRGNLAIFHRDFGRCPGPIPLGSLYFGATLFARPGPMRARIERVND